MNPTTSHRESPEDRLTPLLFTIAPACFLAGWLLMRPIGGQSEPGAWWTAAHAVWLVGFVAFAAMSLRFGRIVGARTSGRRITVRLSFGLVLLSALANVVQLGVDLVGGFRSADRAELQDVFAGVKDIPGAEAVVYGIGAQLVFVGLLVFSILAAVARRAPAWTSSLVVGGTLVMAVAMEFGRNHWLVPVGMALLLAGLAAMGRQFGGTATVRPPSVARQPTTA